MMDHLLPIRMVRGHLDNIPAYDLPAPYTIRPYQPGDEAAWTRIQAEADKHTRITPDLFAQQFGRNAKTLAERQFYLCDATGLPVGTATAWFGTGDRQGWGRVHWVGIVPGQQGRGLAKPLIAAVCNRLHALGHRRAYLNTAALRIPAIRLYLKFGFRPDIQSEQDWHIWRGVRDQIGPVFDLTGPSHDIERKMDE